MSDQPINTPSDVVRARAGQLGDQLGALMSDAIIDGMAKGLAGLMTARTLEEGPWLLHGDGRMYAVTSQHPGECAAFELLRQHTVDWGRCDHPDDCDCSDGRARRLLDRLLDSRIPVEHTGARRVDGALVAHFIAMRDTLDAIAADADAVDEYTRYVARDRVRLADRLLNGEPQ